MLCGRCVRVCIQQLASFYQTHFFPLCYYFFSLWSVAKHNVLYTVSVILHLLSYILLLKSFKANTCRCTIPTAATITSRNGYDCEYKYWNVFYYYYMYVSCISMYNIMRNKRYAMAHSNMCVSTKSSSHLISNNFFIHFFPLFVLLPFSVECFESMRIFFLVRVHQNGNEYTVFVIVYTSLCSKLCSNEIDESWKKKEV